MKKLALIISTLLPLMVVGQNFNLKINISNIKNIKGNIQIGLFNNDGHFLEEGKQYKKLFIKVDDYNMSYTISGLPKDVYALALYHDENLDSIINTNFFGIPTESFGFSKNYKPIFRGPQFNEVSFELNHNREVDIALIDKKG